MELSDSNSISHSETANIIIHIVKNNLPIKKFNYPKDKSKVSTKKNQNFNSELMNKNNRFLSYHKNHTNKTIWKFSSILDNKSDDSKSLKSIG